MPSFSIDPKDRRAYLLGLRIAGDFGAVIAVPVILFVWIGQKLDERYGISPWATVAAFVLAALVSGRMVYKKAKQYAKEYKQVTKTNDSSKP